MASRATPPHQFISAPLMAMIPLMISALAGTPASRHRPRAKYDGLGNMGCNLLCVRVRDWRLAERVGRLASAMVVFQLLIGVHDGRRFLHDQARLLSRQRAVEFLVGQDSAPGTA